MPDRCGTIVIRNPDGLFSRSGIPLSAKVRFRFIPGNNRYRIARLMSPFLEYPYVQFQILTLHAAG